MDIDLTALVAASRPSAVEGAPAPERPPSRDRSELLRNRARPGPPRPAVETPVQPDLRMKVEGHRVLYQLTNPRTGDVIRQVPTEETLRVARNVDRFLEEQNEGAEHHLSVET